MREAASELRRNFGLDIVRSVAILLVIAAHSLFFLIPFYINQLAELYQVLGAFGVEIFFVLSGFLIGQLIIKEVLSPPSPRGLGRFYVRRWFRTLPPYFLVLALRTVMGNPFNWRYLVFLQNFDRKVMQSFRVSWSLSIEEWFYLIAPFLLLMACRRSRSPAAFFVACGTIAVVALVGRAVGVLKWNIQTRDHVFLRMDSLMIGVMLGGFRAYHRALYQRIARYRAFLFALGLGGVLATAAWLFTAIRNETVNQSVLMRTVFFVPLSISIALLLFSLESSDRVNLRWASKRWAIVVRFISLTSYSLYLIHLSVFEPLWKRNFVTKGVWESVGWMSLALAMSGILATLMYLYFEKPVLRLRDRLTGTSVIELAPAPVETGRI